MNKINQILYFFFLLLFSLSSCNDPLSDPSVKVFHYNQINPISSLDPAFAKSQNNIWAINHIFNGLVQMDDSLNIKPCIATNWELLDSGRTYRFELSSEVYFHDSEVFPEGKGRVVTANDVVYSFNRLIDPAVNSPGSWLFTGKLRAENPFIAVSDSIFEMHLSTPFRPMLGILTMQYCSVVPKEGVEFYATQWRSNPVGTGPFKFKRWIENQGLYLIKNANYFESFQGEKLPYLDGVRASFITDRKTALFELLADKLEFISGIESTVIDELLTQEGQIKESRKNEIQFIKSPYLNMEYLGINHELIDENSAFYYKEIRQALNYAIDRESMLKNLRNNVGKPANSGFIPRGLPSHDPEKVKGYHYDRDKALDLLSQAGFPNGKGLEPISIYTNNDYLDLTTFIARQWEELGLIVKIELMESATLREGMRKSTIPLFRASWIADYPDEESFFCMFYSSNPPPPNYTRFKNGKFDQLYKEAIIEIDEKKRIEIYQEMDRLLIEEAPVIFLFYDETALFATNRISGFSKNAINLLQVKHLKEK
jgi:peptide/nickel transport system substrate-binding protein